MKTEREKKLEIALLKEKIERISNKKVLFKEKEDILVPRNLDTRDKKYKQKILKLLQQKVYDGNLDLSDLPFELKDLGNLEKVNGYLNLYNTSIKSLGNLKHVGGSLDLENSSITSLGNLKYVNGYLNLYNTSITSLGNLEYIGDYLNLHNSPIKDLGNLKEVNGNILIKKEQEGKIKGLEKFNYKTW